MPETAALKAEITALEAQISNEQTQLDSDNSQLAQKKQVLDNLEFINRIEALTPAQIATTNNTLLSDGSKITLVITA